MARTSAPVLSLDTIDPSTYPTIAIDGVAYTLTPPDALPPVDAVRGRKAALRFHALIGKENLTDADNLEALAALEQVCCTVLKAPPEVIAKLSPGQQQQVYEAFLRLSPTIAALLDRSTTRQRVAADTATGRTGRTGRTTPSRTGARSRRGSHGRTGAIPSGG